VSLLDVSTSVSHDGRTLTLAAINRSATEAITARLARDAGDLPSAAHCHDLGADASDLFATNSLADPGVCALRDRGTVALEDGTYTFPAHSVTLLTFAL
jgi:alpha-N-arabinofuranosidase